MTVKHRTLRTLLVAPVVLTVLTSGVSVLLAASPAQAVGGIGNDVSFPQCGGTFPNGQDFGIVGVNDGMPGIVNPCLGPSPSYSGSELYWAVSSSSGTSSQPKASLYVNTSDPGNVSNGAVVTDWPSSGSTPGYGQCTTTTVSTDSGPATAGADSTACAWLYGAQAANQDVADLSAAATAINRQSPPVSVSGSPSGYPWWLDVETGNSWQLDVTLNIAVLQGMVAALSAAGASTIGVYSTSYQWGIITGGTSSSTPSLGGLANWIPGAADLPGAQANCSNASFTGGAVVLTQFPSGDPVGTFDGNFACGSVGSGGGGPLPTRIYGSDAIATSVAISQQQFAAGSAGAVVIARSDFFSDALAGGPLAAANHGPLLITPGGSQSTLDPRVQAEIQRVLPTGHTVYVLGGVLALSPNIDATLSGLGYNVVRLGGLDEYATAVGIAGALGDPSTIFLATGLSFYDALSAVPAAIAKGAAILLTNGNSQAPETALYLAQHAGDTVYAVGGPLAAAGADTSAIAIYGQDLFGTSAAIAGTFFGGAHVYGAATDGAFADALGGGVFMATGGRLGPLLLVDPNSPTISAPVAQYLVSLQSGTPGYVFGGPLAVPAQVLGALQAAVG